MTPHVGTQLLRGTRVVAALCAAVLVGVTGAQLVAATPHARQVDRVSGDALLPAALAVAPFHVRQPTWLPAGMQLHAVNYNPPATDAGVETFAVDFHYVDDASRTLHVWQTNIPNLAEMGKDPTAQGSALPVGDLTWHRVFIDDARGPTLVLSARYPDGVTISLDTTLGEDALVRVAAALK
ncbi:MAG: DUF4245 family protein [Candidatus Limnocylindria bacterium]